MCGRLWRAVRTWKSKDLHGLRWSRKLACRACQEDSLKTIASFIVALIIFVLSPAAETAFAQVGSAPSSPAPSGTTLTGIVECGEGYTSHELYDMKITLVEVVRGEEAWKRIREASSSNKPPQSGMEYLVARVRYEYHARGTPGTCIHELTPGEFTAYSSTGEDYTNPSVVAPKPELRKGLKSGDTFEGWVVFAVPQTDKAPLMSYSAADSGGAVEHGGGKWFSLR
jgi:hypothetical protein